MRRLPLLLAVAAVLLLPTLVAVPFTVANPMSDGQAQAVRSFVRDAMHQLGAPGVAVVIVDKDGIRLAEGFGLARDDGTPVTPETPFEIASLSKQLTSIAVMQLVQSGDLRLQATVHSYIDWFGSDGSDTGRITVRDLLAHTSGWSGEQGLINRLDEANDAQAIERNVRRLASEPLDHKIGQFEYSNANYDTLGELVAVVSGVSYEEYMAEHVLGPLQMTHTHLTDAGARADGLAQGHYPFFGIPIAWQIPWARSSLPSSFIAASAEDLGHVLIAHLNGGAYQRTQVLRADAMAKLRRPLTHPDPWDGYGWGWWSYPLWNAGELKDGTDVSAYELPVMLEHNGSHATYASGMALLPKQEIGVVVLINMNNELASSRFYELHTGIAQILLGRQAPALAYTEDLLGQYGKFIALAWVVTLLLLVAWMVRRFRRWGRDPASTPRGALLLGRRVVLPLLIDAALVGGFWWLASTRGEIAITLLVRIVRLWPDIGLVMVLVNVIGLGWAVIGTVWIVRLLRRREPISPRVQA
jgi:CubicO group peptidase (beta-lactamase class C family)